MKKHASILKNAAQKCMGNAGDSKSTAPLVLITHFAIFLVPNDLFFIPSTMSAFVWNLKVKLAIEKASQSKLIHKSRLH